MIQDIYGKPNEKGIIKKVIALRLYGYTNNE